MQVIICIAGSHPRNFPLAFFDSVIPVWARGVYYIHCLKQVFPRYYSHLELYNIFLKSFPQKTNPNTKICNEISELKIQFSH